MFLLAEAIFYGVTYNKIKKKCNKHVDIKSEVMNTKKKRKQTKQLVKKNLSKRNNRKHEHMKKTNLITKL
jgi:hypothetical protein